MTDERRRSSYLERQLARRRSERVVVNVPAPTVIVTPQPPPEGKTVSLPAKIWSIAKIVGPALISVAAIIISLVTFLDQRAANSDQRLAQGAIQAQLKEQWADRVSFLLLRKTQPPYFAVQVQNSSASPMTDVFFIVGILSGISVDGELPTLLFSGPDLPSCSIGTVNISAAETLATARNSKVTPMLTVRMMYFRDRDGLYWKYDLTGVLQQVTEQDFFESLRAIDFAYSATATFNTLAAGCA